MLLWRGGWGGGGFSCYGDGVSPTSSWRWPLDDPTPLLGLCSQRPRKGNKTALVTPTFEIGTLLSSYGRPKEGCRRGLGIYSLWHRPQGFRFKQLEGPKVVSVLQQYHPELTIRGCQTAELRPKLRTPSSSAVPLT